MERLGIDEITASYLNLQTPKENRGNVLFFVLFFLNFIGLLPLIGDPFVYSFFIIAFIPTMIINIWGILYVIDPYRFELSYYLYLGIYSVVNVFVYSLVLAKLMVTQFGVQGIFSIVLILLVMNSLPLIMNWLNVRLLYSGTYLKLQTGKWKTPTWALFLIASPGVGYVIYGLVNSFGNEIAIRGLFFLCIFVLSIIVAFFSASIHRYFFLKRNIEAVRKVYPAFGRPKHIQGGK
ncbi:hypothetical protein [Sporosarcina ureilytica]|uniref:Uncharacterized protein n=1 Tax=Sporosarcina ureilytica TaxID=298596 RepID=A0A1D8JD09_9BACL|nr:hypothetical protein [Sporosarcina ureilytica]AOV06592.1 hypothetical protein BI350_02535 [Sporosarcina ureilytica]